MTVARMVPTLNIDLIIQSSFAISEVWNSIPEQKEIKNEINHINTLPYRKDNIFVYTYDFSLMI